MPRLAGHTHVFEDVGHFIEEYKGPEIGDSIADLAEEVTADSGGPPRAS